MLSVLIVDDTRLYLEALATLLMSEPQVVTVVTAANAEEALLRMTNRTPDVVLLNAAMAGSRAVLYAISRAADQTPVVAVGVRESEDEVVAWAEAGVSGYLFREQSLASLRAVIQSVARGETICPPRVAATLLRRIATLASAPGYHTSEFRSPNGLDRLTRREQEIVRLIDEGLSNKEIARSLCIEIRTVKNHVHNILRKLQVHRRADAAAWVRRAAQDVLDQ